MKRRQVLKTGSLAGLVGISKTVAGSTPESGSASRFTQSRCKNCLTTIEENESYSVFVYSPTRVTNFRGRQRESDEETYFYRREKKKGRIWMNTVPTSKADTLRSKRLSDMVTTDESVIVRRSKSLHEKTENHCPGVWSDHEAVGATIETGDDLVDYSLSGLSGAICGIIPVPVAN
ncbi:MAG: hypothetical protein V5A21_10060, partial [Halapricum sp.]